MRYLNDGWELDSLAAVETFYYAGYRRVDIFYFTLKLDGKVVEMPVLANPVTHRLVEERKLTVLRVNAEDRKSTRLNSSHANISYAVFCLKKKKTRVYVSCYD